MTYRNRSISKYANGATLEEIGDAVEGIIESGATPSEISNLIANTAISPSSEVEGGEVDASDEIETLFNSEKPVKLNSSKVYKITRAITIEDKDVNLLDSAGAELLFYTDDAQITFKYNYSETQDVSSVDNTATIDMSNGTSLTETPCTKLTISDGTVYASGDVVKIVADDILNGTDPDDYNKIGEHAVVFSVNENEIYLDRRLVANDGNYVTNVRIAKSSTKQCNLGSFSINGYSSNKTSRNISHIVVNGCANYNQTGRISSKDTQANVFNFRSCYSPKTQSIHAVDGVTDSSVGAFAHTILNTCGTTDFVIDLVSGRNMRHLCDTTAASVPSNNGSIDAYGGVVGGFCATVYGVGMQSSPASTHSSADNIRYGQVVSVSPIHGTSGVLAAVGLRGRNCHVDYSDADGCIGVYAFTDYDDEYNSRGHSVGSVVVRNNGALNRGRAFLVTGSSSSSIVDLTIDSIQWKAPFDNNASAIGQTYYGDVFVSTVNARGVSDSSSGTIDMFEVGEDGRVEINSFVGRKMGGFSLVDVQEDSSTFRVSSVDIETNGEPWGYLAKMNGNDGTLRIGSAVIDSNGANSDLILSRGDSADIIADWVVTESETAAIRNRKRLTTIIASTATTYDIDVLDIGAQTMYQKVITSIVGASIGDISDGLFLGQELIISNDLTSTETLSVPDNTSGLRVVDDFTLEPKESIRAIWDGFNWLVSC